MPRKSEGEGPDGAPDPVPAATAPENAYDTPLGRFVLRRSTAYDQLQLGMRRSYHLRRAVARAQEEAKARGETPLDLQDDAYADLLAQAMAAVDVFAVEKPAGLDWATCTDVTSVLEVYQKHDEWQLSFRPARGGPPAEGGGGAPGR